MKTNREILSKYGNWDVTGMAEWDVDCIIEAMSEVEQQTRDEMFEFVEFIGRGYYSNSVGTHHVLRYADQRDGANWKTTKELFEYWQLNIKKK